MAQQKERSVVPTARRRYGGGGPGKPFAPGTNSHDGQVFRRGSDLIPRGDITSLYPVLMQDDGAIAIELLSYTCAYRPIVVTKIGASWARGSVDRGH
jgi:hypothetical protein